MWEENWESREEKIGDEESVRDFNVKRGGQGGREGAKKRKVESAEGVVWGEQVSQEELERRRFLEERTGAKQGTKQARIKFLSGKEWLMREILKEVANLAVDVAYTLTAGFWLNYIWQTHRAGLGVKRSKSNSVSNS